MTLRRKREGAYEGEYGGRAFRVFRDAGPGRSWGFRIEGLRIADNGLSTKRSAIAAAKNAIDTTP